MKKKYKLILLFSLCVLISSGGTSQHRNSKSDKSHRTFSQPDSNRIFPSSTTKIISTSNKENVPFLNNNSSQNRLVYCEPNFSSCSSDHINKVIFAGINNDSECGTGHNDYTDQVGLVVTGETYTISVRNQALSSQNVFAYIDWNQNGILNDVGEVYTIANNAHHSGPHTQEITIPQDAVLGETRMRVVLQWNNTNANPCIVYGTGESEDYSLNVVDEIPNTPVNCSQLVPASNYGNGHFFMGQTNQKLAIDIDILPESTFEVNNVIIQTLDQATTFDLVFYDDDDGFPGTPFRTLNDVSIIEEIYLGTGTDYQYYKYTLDISSDAVQFEGEQLGRKVWMEVISDATAWNNTNNTALGSLGVFNNNNTDSWTITEVEFVYELIGNCTGSQIQDLPNNVCTNAIPFNCGNLVTGTTVGADDFGGNLSPDVFYSYTGSGQMENISLSLCSGTEFDTLIRVFSDCSLANEITFNDNFCGGQSVVNFISDGISTYYIMIEGGDTNSMGDFTLYASCTAIPAQNENPAQAIVLECGDRVQGSNVNASNTAGNPAGDVFYTYTGSGVAEDITISLCSIFTSYDTEIRVYDDISLSNLVGFADDDCGKFSQVTFYSDGETTYYIMIEGSEIEEGNFDLRVSCWDYTPYCSPLNFVFVEPITNVEIADIAHRSSAEPTSPPHEVFTDIIGNLNQGETYEITLEGFTGADGEWNNFFTVFIDWNQNNVFNDAGEMYEIGSIFDSSGTDGNQLIGTITVPNDVELGTTIMRVIKAYPNYPTDPCASYGYGQVEDYTINVLDALGNDDFTLNKITHFPNPTENEINIESDLPLSKITIYDIAGKVIQVIKPDSNNVQLDLSYLSNGIYLAKVITKQEVQTFKIIKE